MLGERPATATASLGLGPVEVDNDNSNTQRGIDNLNAVVFSVSPVPLESAPYEAAREARHAVPGTSTTLRTSSK